MSSDDIKDRTRCTDAPKATGSILMQRKLDAHIIFCEERNLQQDLYIQKLLQAQEQTTKSIDALVASTQGLVDSWKFLFALRSFILWVSAFTIPAGALYTKLKGWW